MLSVKNVSKTYKNGKQNALKDVTFDINEGEFVGLLGQNGAGKSTLINVLSSNVIKNSGEVFIGKNDLDKNELATKRVIGVVPQEIVFDFVFTVNEVLNIQSGYFGIKNNQTYIDHLLESLSLTDKKDTNCRMLSGGMKRRLLIAKALVHKPKLLILDEPTAGVDIELRHSLYEFLRKLHKEGTTIILTTHYLEEAEELCDRIIIINDGKLIKDQKKDLLMKELGNESVMKFYFDFDINENDFNFLKKYSTKFDKQKFKLKIERNKISEIFQELTKNNINYANVVLENQKLEDVFLKLVKR
jgi:ABC-2 type transport system ATP-binding protein